MRAMIAPKRCLLAFRDQSGCSCSEILLRSPFPLTNVKLLGMNVRTGICQHASGRHLSSSARNYYVHPTAVVSPGARIGPGSSVGAFAVVGSHVSLGAGVSIGPHAVIAGCTSIGAGSEIHPFAVVGGPPQDRKHIRNNRTSKSRPSSEADIAEDLAANLVEAPKIHQGLFDSEILHSKTAIHSMLFEANAFDVKFSHDQCTGGPSNVDDHDDSQFCKIRKAHNKDYEDFQNENSCKQQSEPQKELTDTAKIKNNAGDLESTSVEDVFDSDSRLELGAGVIVREFATVNGGSSGGGGLTAIGDGCLLLTGCHVGHDCVLASGVVLSNLVQLAGHVHVGAFATIGGAATIRQHVNIGRLAMIGGASAVDRHVPPFTLAVGNRAKLRGLNLVGLRRRKTPRSEIAALRTALDIVFGLRHLRLEDFPHGELEESPVSGVEIGDRFVEMTMAERAARMATMFKDIRLVQEFLTFVEGEVSSDYDKAAGLPTCEDVSVWDARRRKIGLVSFSKNLNSADE